MYTHIAFSDESNWNSGRFRAISLITLKVEDVDSLNQTLNLLLASSGVSEFKWKNFNGAKQRFAAEKKINAFFAIHDINRIRLDVIVWDISDSRHSISGRDDAMNLAIMYYHLLNNVFKNRWPDNAIWKFIPDEHSEINWVDLQKILNTVSERIESLMEIPLEDSASWSEISDFVFSLRKYFHVYEIEQGNSSNQPILQMADLFAGLCCFSWEIYDKYELWLKIQDSSLFTLTEDLTHSKRDKERFPLLKYFDDQCKSRKVRVSLKTNRGLMSMDPDRNINIWFYKPQHSKDKAPQKRR